MILKDLYDMHVHSKRLHNDAHDRWISPKFYMIDEAGNKVRAIVELEQDYVGDEITISVRKYKRFG